MLVGISGPLFDNPTPTPTETARNETMIASLDAADAGTFSVNILMANPPPKPAPVAAATPPATAAELANVDEVLAADAAALLAA